MEPQYITLAITCVLKLQDYGTWTDGNQELQFGFVRTGESLETHTSGQLMYNESYDVVTYGVYLQPHTQSKYSSGSCMIYYWLYHSFVHPLQKTL